VTEASAANPDVSCSGCGEDWGDVMKAALNEAVSVTFVCPWCGSDNTQFNDPRPEDRSVWCNDCSFNWDYDPY
jgi:predicted RNA-binding Zn-ribbon protein involved in translation (DUF1610 family)